MRDQTDTSHPASTADATAMEILALGGGGVYGLKTGALAGLAVLGPLGVLPGAIIGLGAGSLAGRTVLRWLRGT